MLPANETHIRTLRKLDQLPAEILVNAPQDLAGYWLAKRKNCITPDRNDFDPLEMPPSLLPFLILWSVSDGDFRCRLAGTEVCNAAGRELKGMSLTEMHKDDSREVWEEFATVARGDCYSYIERTMAWSKKDYALYQRLMLPLSVDKKGARYLVGAFAFPRRTNLSWVQWHAEEQPPA